MPDGENQLAQQGGGYRPSLVPIPDPTALTTEAIRRDIDHLRELLSVRIAALEDSLDAYQESHADQHRSKAHEVKEAIDHLTELCAERFAGVQLQLLERDARSQESTVAGKEAIAAALAAQKEAVAKSEQATKEQLESIKSENATTVAALESKIENVKELVGTINTQFGQQTGRTGGLDLATSRTLTAVGLVIAFVGVVLTVIIMNTM